jgi:hypothetical protein
LAIRCVVDPDAVATVATVVFCGGTEVPTVDCMSPGATGGSPFVDKDVGTGRCKRVLVVVQGAVQVKVCWQSGFDTRAQ